MQFNEFVNNIIEQRKLPKNFFNPNVHDICPIKDLKNSKLAIDKIKKHIDDKSNIVVYADVDIDGVTATLIAYQWLKNINANVTYVYHEKNKGHGVIANKVPINDFLIVVDSSSSITKKLSELIESGTTKDILIIDHHEIDGEIYKSDNITVVNPFQVGCNYGNRNASGALLTWRIFDYLEKTYYKTNYANGLMYLASMSIVSDSMGVDSMENRYYFYAGNRFDTPAFKAIDSYKAQYPSKQLALAVHPLLNATIRDGNMGLVFEFLLSEDVGIAKLLLKQIQDIYNRNKEEVKVAMGDMKILYEDDTFMIIMSDFKLRGYLATRVENKFGKSTLALSTTAKPIRGKMLYTGSGRALEDINLKSILEETGLVSCMGHQQAFGVSIEEKNLLKLTKALEDIEIPTYEIETDLYVDTDDIDVNEIMFVNYCNFLTGNGFKSLLYKIDGLAIKKFGASKSGNKYFTDNNEIRYSQYNDIWLNKYSVDEMVDVTGTLTLENWFSREQLVMVVEKIEESSDDGWD